MYKLPAVIFNCIYIPSDYKSVQHVILDTMKQ